MTAQSNQTLVTAADVTVPHSQTLSISSTSGARPDEKISRLSRCFSLIILIAFPSFYASRASHLDAIIRLRSTTLAMAHDLQAPTSTPSACSHVSIEDTWTVYLNSRVAEWKVVFTLACVLVGLSLAVFQIPQAANNPFTYTFASFTQCRAFAGLVYAGMLHVYFESEHTHTGRFAMMWWKSVVESKDNIWNTWVMLALPAASTLWALLFYLLAMLSFFFRSTAPIPDNHPTPTSLALTIILRIIITASTLLDFICFTYIWITLKGYSEKYYATHDVEV